MSTAVITPGALHGSLAAPPSKSMGHRALLCAALAKGESVLSHLSDSQDMLATLGAIEALGATVSREQTGEICVTGIAAPPKEAAIPCRESGSTLRFLIPIAAALGVTATFSGEGRLPERTYRPLAEALAAHGVWFDKQSGMPFTLCGALTSGQYTLPGDISSQFITGLLYALPLLSGESEITLSSPLESAGYVDMTIAALAAFGVSVKASERGYLVPGAQRFLPQKMSIEGDYSNAAFWLCAGALGGGVSCTGLDTRSVQGDKAVCEILCRLGAVVKQENGRITARRGALRAVEIDASQVPDLVPVLCVVAALCEGVSTIYNAARLRLKECDRLFAMAKNLAALGVLVKEEPDRLIITGAPALSGGSVQGFNDHRIVMALSVAGSAATGPVTISDAHAVNKSYPEFFDCYRSLGGIADVL